MPEQWRMGPGTLKERWLSLGYDVRWSDAPRAYRIRPARAAIADNDGDVFRLFGNCLLETVRTVQEVEAWVAEHQVE